MCSARWLPANPVIPVMRTRIARQISKSDASLACLASVRACRLHALSAGRQSSLRSMLCVCHAADDDLVHVLLRAPAGVAESGRARRAARRSLDDALGGVAFRRRSDL